MKSLPSIVILAGLLAAAMLPTREVAASCPTSRSWPSDAGPIPVFINTNVTDLCDGLHSTCTSFDDIRESVESATQQLSQESFTNLSFDVIGATNQAPGKAVHGGIHIFAGPCAGADLGVTAYPQAGPGEMTWATLRICTENSHGEVSWRPHGRSDDPGRRPLHNLLLRELYYAVGSEELVFSTDASVRTIRSPTLREDSSHLFEGDTACAEYLYPPYSARMQVRSKPVMSSPLQMRRGVV